MYSLEFTSQAIEDLKWLKKTDQSAYKKVQKLLLELLIIQPLEQGSLN